MVTLIDSYSETNQDYYNRLRDKHPSDSLYPSSDYQSFTCGSTIKITSAKFYLKKTGSPGGNAHAVLYAHGGTYGTSSVPTGPALATSDDFDVRDLTTDYALVTFAFTGAEQYEMQADTKYCIAFENPTVGSISTSSYIWIGYDMSDAAHSGNRGAYANGAYSPTSIRDECFYVYGETAGVEHTHFSTDTMGISDSIQAAMTFNVPLSDTLGIGDSLATPVMQFNVALADTLSISDSLTSAIMEFKVALSDTVSISDSLVAAATYNVALADTMGISDSLAVAAAYAIALADTMGISDSLAAGWVFYVSLTDRMDISDSLSVEEIEAVVRRIRRGQIYGFKPARVAKAGRVGV